MDTSVVEPTVGREPAKAPEAAFERRLARTEEAIGLYHCHLQNYVFGLTHNPHDTEDILAALWKNVLLRFPEERMLQIGLLRRKAYQLFVDHYRSARSRRETYPGELPDAEAPAGETSYSPENEAEFQRRFWEEHPVDLTDAQRTALWLHAREGRTYAEISRLMDVPSSTVGDWIQLARTRLADYLNEE